MVGLDKPLAQTFGPNVGFKLTCGSAKTSVLPQCKVEGLAWWG